MAGLVPVLDKKSTDDLNLSVLQRFDPDVEDILVKAGHVAQYILNTEQMQWAKGEVEGSMFVVKRRSQPRFKFIILNQRSTENLVQDILGDFQCEVSKPYLFYRHNGEVSGIWFYNEDECDGVVKLVQRIQGMFKANTVLPPKPKLEPKSAPSANPPAVSAPPPSQPEPVSHGTPIDINMLLGQTSATGAAAPEPQAPAPADPAAAAAPQLLTPQFFLQQQQQQSAGSAAPPPESHAEPSALDTFLAKAEEAAEAKPVPAMLTAAQLEQQMVEGMSAMMTEARPEAAQPTATHVALTPEVVRKAMLNLVTNDAFVEMVTEALNKASAA